MKANQTSLKTHAILQYLKEHTNETKPVTMPELVEYLERNGLESKRRSMYGYIQALKDRGEPIVYTRFAPKGYYYKHAFTKAEVMLLVDDVNMSPSLSIEESNQLTKKLKDLLPNKQATQLPPSPKPPFKTENANVLNNIEILLDAVATSNYVSFLYFDYDENKKKVYRHNKREYQLRPYAILSHQNRYYCIFQHTDDELRNFRIDKMDQLAILDKPFNPIQFNLDDYMGKNFDMYQATATTITAIIQRSLLPVIYDRFGFDTYILEKDIENETLTINFKASISPTLIGWLLQFYDKLTVVKPQFLIDELKTIATTIQNTYKE